MATQVVFQRFRKEKANRQGYLNTRPKDESVLGNDNRTIVQK